MHELINFCAIIYVVFMDTTKILPIKQILAYFVLVQSLVAVTSSHDGQTHL